MSSPQVTFDPNASYAPTSPAPTAGGGNAPSFDPNSSYSAAPDPLTQNPQGQGVYQMQDSTGNTVGVPYGNVGTASKKGYTFAGDDEFSRFRKDANADPNSEDDNSPAKQAIIKVENATPLGQVATGINQGVGDMVDMAKNIPAGIWNSLPPVAAYKSIKQTLPLIDAYEKARSSGASISDALVAVNQKADDQNAMVQALKQRVDDFSKNPTQASARLITDAAGMIGAAYATGGISSEAAPAEVDALSPVTVESAVQNAASKSGLPEGEAAQTASPVEDPQPALQQGIRNVASSTADDAGVDYQEPASIRDAMGTTARGVTNAAKADYAALDEASGGRWQRFSDQIKNVQDKMNEVNGIDDDAYSNLEYKRNDLETSQAQMVEDMKEAGKVDPDIADRAVAQYKRGMALQDVNNAIKATTKRVPVDGQVQEVVDPNGLSLRLSKLNDTPPTGGNSRLVQALGEDNAQQLISHVDNAQVAKAAIQDFTPTNPTGQKAMAEMLRPFTESKLVLPGTKTNFMKAFASYEKLPPEEQTAQFGEDAPQARTYLKSQARKQALWAIGKWAGGGGLGLAAHYTGVSKALLHFLIE